MPSRGDARKLARLALLLTVGVVLGRLEALLPPLPVPGAKLGLTNVALLAAVACEGFGAALCVTLARCLVNALWGGPFSLLYSLAGAALAWCGMALILRMRGISLVGASVLGAALHHIGQLAMAALLTGSGAVWAYLPVLTLVGVGTGSLMGALSIITLRTLVKSRLITPGNPAWIMLP